MTNHSPISRSTPRPRVLLPLVSVLVLAQAAAAGIMVTNTNDSGTGSLREAFLEAAGAGGFDTIDFDASLNGQTITLLSQITIASDQVGVDASALSRGIIVSGGGTVRIFQVNSSAALNLTRLHLTRGHAGANNGGAILTSGTMTLTDCTFTENNANRGGAVFALGPGSLTLQRSTFSNNTADDSGALWVEGTHSVGLSNSTISLNRSTAAGGTGAITVLGGSLNVVHSTISANAGDSFGGGIFTQAPLIVERSIIAANTATGGAAADIFKGGGGTVTATGPSLIGSNQTVTMEFPAAPPLVGTSVAPVDPQLGPLFRTGGLTATHSPGISSPALEMAGSSPLSIDQRGFPRGIGSASDLGAVERGPVFFVTSLMDDGSSNTLRSRLDAATAPDTRLLFHEGISGQTITLTSAQLTVPAGRSVEIDASLLPAGVTISGDNARRVLQVDAGGTLSLRGLSIRNGREIQDGAGIYSFGNLLAVDCTFASNTSESFGGALSAEGGIAALHRCNLSGNLAEDGGAILLSAARLSLTNCTVSGNQGSPFSGGAGGLSSITGTLDLVHTTVTGNTGRGLGGGLYLNSSTVARIERCVIAGNFDTTNAKDILGTGATIVPIGNNVIGVNDTVSGQFPQGQYAGTSGAPLDAKLGPLGFYGGRTQAIPLRPGSPALQAGTGSTSIMDQRSFRRPVGAAADLGAYEAGTFANFAAWSEETAGATLSATGDNDFDGAKNLLEYALRRNALVPDVTLSPTLSPTFNGLADAHLFSFRYQSAARDLRYIIQRNPGLLSAWENVVTIDLSAGTNTGDPGLVINPALEMISLMDPPPNTDPAPPPANFYRLVVELVP